jgi:hypothetical protein
MDKPRDRLTKAREAAGRTPQEMAKIASLNVPSYYDLEWCDDEIFRCLNLDELQAICKELRIVPRDLFTGEHAGGGANAISFDFLAKQVSHYLEEQKMSQASFEDMVGWELGEFLQNPQAANKWNIDCLQDICRPLKIDWLDVLPV